MKWASHPRPGPGLPTEINDNSELLFGNFRPFHSSPVVTMPVSAYTTEERGETNTDSYKVFVKDSQGPVSPFHDIPLASGDNTFHMVVEVPR